MVEPVCKRCHTSSTPVLQQLALLAQQQRQLCQLRLEITHRCGGVRVGVHGACVNGCLSSFETLNLAGSILHSLNVTSSVVLNRI
jgi:hypothetical protein